MAGRAESSGCDKAWSSAAMSGRKRAILGPADWPEDPKNPQYRSRCLDGTSWVCDIMAKGANQMLENCQETEVSLLCTPLTLLTGLITDCASLVLIRLIIWTGSSRTLLIKHNFSYSHSFIKLWLNWCHMDLFKQCRYYISGPWMR